MIENIDCHYCEYAMTNSPSDSVDCYVEDFAYFDHHIKDSKEAENCDCFEYSDIFPKT